MRNLGRRRRGRRRNEIVFKMNPLLRLIQDQVIAIGLSEIINRFARRDVFLDDGPDQCRHFRIAQVNADHPATQTRVKWIKEQGARIGKDESGRVNSCREVLKELIRPTILLEEEESR